MPMGIHRVVAEVHLAVELHLVRHDHGPDARHSIFEHLDAIGSGAEENIGKRSS